MSQMLTERDIQEIVRRIVEVADPERIILFGSYANGTATEDSDVDLLVVTEALVGPREETVRVRRALDPFRVGFDLILCSTEDFEVRRQAKWHIVYEADKTGRLLYDRRGIQPTGAQRVA